jgi:hypothetical protein
VAERFDGFGNEWFECQNAGQPVEFRDGPEKLGVEFVALSTKNILNDVAAYFGVVHGVECALSIRYFGFRNCGFGHLPLESLL